MQLIDDPTKHRYQYRYVELGHHIIVNDKASIPRKQDAHKNPVLADPHEVEEFRKAHNNVGIFKGIWYWPDRVFDPSRKCWSGFYMDLDNSDLRIAHEDIKKIASYLYEALPEESVHIYFSGGKGFHVETEAISFNIDPATNLPELFRFLANKLQERLDISSIDFAVYERRRIFRLENSRHQSSGLYKVELGHTGVFWSLDKILEYAKEPQELIRKPVEINVSAVEWYTSFVSEFEDSQVTRFDRIKHFEKYGSMPKYELKNTELEFDPVGAFAGDCKLIPQLYEKAEKQHDLSHIERLALCSFLSYDEESLYYLHQMLANCEDYNEVRSNSYIQDWIRRREKGIGGHPYSCRKLMQNNIGCGNCDKLEAKAKYTEIDGYLKPTGEISDPSPIRFYYQRKDSTINIDERF